MSNGGWWTTEGVWSGPQLFGFQELPVSVCVSVAAATAPRRAQSHLLHRLLRATFTATGCGCRRGHCFSLTGPVAASSAFCSFVLLKHFFGSG